MQITREGAKGFGRVRTKTSLRLMLAELHICKAEAERKRMKPAKGRDVTNGKERWEFPRL